ncbi:hypothetical protein Patl1_00766 [Pistacia atlantica]|uniref:Uncharacterized protein n=1 Tax=Pistacia atlantica TaxID=434234 RepID=A0ACC1CCT6_9ROSI|nr:hypothetical protein Patl1_00766 [Pistacia atlantica]
MSNMVAVSRKNLILVKEMIGPGLSSSMEKSDLSSE